MSQRKDKEKVLGETFDDERIKTFLNYPAPAGINPDYFGTNRRYLDSKFHHHNIILNQLYRGMLGDNFNTFVKFFVEAGKDVNAIGPEGKTFLQVVKTHRNGEEYAAALAAAGAK